jgi:hypothetical protein
VADWCLVHRRLVALGAERAQHERELCRWLLSAERLGVHVRVGYASLGEYAERVAGLGGRQTEERLRVGRALAELPALDAALARGELCWSAVRELSRVATAETEREWLGWAKGRRSRQIEQAVATRRRGDRPRDRADPSLMRHGLHFEVRPETLALFRDLQAQVRADLGGSLGGGPIDDDTLLFEIARRALGGPGDDGRASYQVALTRCEECGRSSIDAGGRSHPVDEGVAEMAACDGQRVGRVHGDAPQQIPVAAGGVSPHAGASQGAGGVSSHGVAPAASPAPPPAAPTARAKQDIPPAVRRQVMRRDGKRCVVSECANHLFLDVHHLDLRSEGGGHDAARLAVLCGAHHRAAHAGSLCISGSASEGFTFRHADGSAYGAPLQPRAIDVAQHVLGALRNLGFRPTDARTLVDAVVRAGAPEDPAAFLRAALQAS